jgi:hypothetical protein
MYLIAKFTVSASLSYIHSDDLPDLNTRWFYFVTDTINKESILKIYDFTTEILQQEQKDFFILEYDKDIISNSLHLTPAISNSGLFSIKRKNSFQLHLKSYVACYTRFLHQRNSISRYTVIHGLR